MAAVRRGAWVGLKYVTSLFFVGVIVQFFLVGYGLFAMKHGATIDNAKSLDAHRGFGFILTQFGALLMLILVLLAWPTPRKLLGLWILLCVLTFPVQPILAASGVPPQVRRHAPPGERADPARPLRLARPLRVDNGTDEGGGGPRGRCAEWVEPRSAARARHRVLVTRPDPPGPRRHHRPWMPCIVRVWLRFRRVAFTSARTMVWSGQDLLFGFCPVPQAGGRLGGWKCSAAGHWNDCAFHAAERASRSSLYFGAGT